MRHRYTPFSFQNAALAWGATALADMCVLLPTSMAEPKDKDVVAASPEEDAALRRMADVLLKGVKHREVTEAGRRVKMFKGQGPEWGRGMSGSGPPALCRAACCAMDAKRSRESGFVYFCAFHDGARGGGSG